MTPAEAKMRILAEWRTWIGHQQAAASHHTASEVSGFVVEIERNHPELVSFEGPEDKLQVIRGWLSDAGLIK